MILWYYRVIVLVKKLFKCIETELTYKTHKGQNQPKGLRATIQSLMRHHDFVHDVLSDGRKV